MNTKDPRARLYLDWNATAPLRDEARRAMVAAMDVAGNPSSIHAEGRAAKALIERARADIAQALGAEGADIVFTSGATEAAALVCAGRGLHSAGIEHEAVLAWCQETLSTDQNGHVTIDDPANCAVQYANSETGIVQDLPSGLAVTDLTQAFGKLPLAFNALGCHAAFVSAHKIGGPKGIGAVILKSGQDIPPQIRGGGQEMGRRAGTENLIGIAGFAAAAKAAMADLSNGIWEEVAYFRNILNLALLNTQKQTILLGKEGRLLPNTTCVIAPGWRGDTQVMAMDLAGFAVSAGSACSSGKIRSSRVLRAMGYNDELASQALRISLGPGLCTDDVSRFAEVWTKAYDRATAQRAND